MDRDADKRLNLLTLLPKSVVLTEASQCSIVSVVIPAFGRANFLREGLRMLLSDDYRHLDIVVVDDGSPQDIQTEMASEFLGAPVRFVRQPNSGTTAARNLGASLARGDYLLFIDDDDLLIPESLAWRVEVLNSEPQVVAVAGRCQFLRDTIRDECQPAFTANSFYHWDFLSGNRFYSPGQVLIRRSAFDASGGFRGAFNGCEDWELWVRLAMLGPVIADNRLTLDYRFHDGNYSRKVALMCKTARRVVEEITKSLCPAHMAIGRYLAYEYVCNIYADKLRSARQSAIAVSDSASCRAVASEIRRMKRATNHARLLLKWALIRDHKRFRMSASEISIIGRQCPDCAGRWL